MSVYRCPECLNELCIVSDQLKCTACRKKYPVVDGLPIFSNNRVFYYGEVPKEVMRNILARASSVGWNKALLETVSENPDDGERAYFLDYATSELRSGFKFLLERFESGTVLDYGCGPGAITTSLARNYATVYATDLTLERAQFTQLRARQENLRNVTVFCSGDTRHIPLKDKSVDVIVVNGVLERVPEGTDGHPRSVQLEFLRELRRILSETGVLFIGIENRFGFGYLLGKREEHARLRYISLLPRKIADLYSQLMHGKPYRSYTYSRIGYKSLLRAAGFMESDFWGFIPDYREVSRAVRLSDPTMINGTLAGQVTVTKRLRNLIIRPLFRVMSESFGILGGNVTSEPYIMRLIDHISAVHLKDARLSISKYSVDKSGIVLVRILSDETDYVIKLPLSAKAEHRSEVSLRISKRISRSVGSHLNIYLMPRPVASDRYLDQAYCVETLIPGQVMTKLVANTSPSVFFSGLVEYLSMLCKSSMQVGGSWAEILRRSARKYGLRLANYHRRWGIPEDDVKHKINDIADYLGRVAPQSDGFLCAIHGDFWQDNILFVTPGMQVAGVLHWESYESKSLPFIDMFNCIIKKDEDIDQVYLNHRVMTLHKALGGKLVQSDLIRNYARRIGVDESVIPYFLMLYWIRQSSLLLKCGRTRLRSDLGTEAIGQSIDYFHRLTRA